MCGITACVSLKNKDALKLAVDSLKLLEYRGYDSYGFAYPLEGELQVIKRIGKISEFRQPEQKKTTAALGHTRWATHGAVCEKNTHPHLSNNNEIAVVHNGIIENHLALRGVLEGKGFEFKSETDTEVIPHFIELRMRDGNSFDEAATQASKELKGRYAFVAYNLSSGDLFAARDGSPLIFGIGKDAHFISSDFRGFLKYTNKAAFLNDGEAVYLQKGKKPVLRNTRLTQKNKTKKKFRIEEIAWKAEESEKSNYPYYIEKEIYEQPEILRGIAARASSMEKLAEEINKAKGTFLVGCGSSANMCLTATYLFSRIAKKHVNFSVGSEFPAFHHFIKPETLLIGISQSGETTDTLESLEVAKSKGAKIATIVNVPGSTMYRLADESILLNAGPEIAVASTKATTAQLAVLLMLVYTCAGKKKEGQELIQKAAEGIEQLLNETMRVKIDALAEKLVYAQNMYVIGKGANYGAALECALKLQEVSYIHTEGFPSGELKHGPIALISAKSPCFVIVPNDETADDAISNAQEVKSRGGYIIGISPLPHTVFDYWIEVPDLGEASQIVSQVPVQLLAYRLSVIRGNNPDRPRNLAKSVTVK